MGLRVSHDCWDGGYVFFHRWRIWLAAQIGIPLELTVGFTDFDALDCDELKAVTRALITANVSDKVFRGTMDPIYALSRSRCAISWDAINDPLVVLLHHSDCDGRIYWWQCKSIAIRLGQILRDPNTTYPDLGFAPKTIKFAIGCLRAWKAREDIIFC